MHTSVGILALAGFLVAPSPVPETLWMTDYRAAQMKGSELKMPLAVVIASGNNGFDRLLKEGNLTQEARSLLAKNYLCVYLDGSRPEYHSLVKAFGFKSEIGLVLSDKKGDYQAFSNDGPISASDLVTTLRRHAPSVPDSYQYVIYVDGKFVPAEKMKPASSLPVQRATYSTADFIRSVQPSSYSTSRTVQNC